MSHGSTDLSRCDWCCADGIRKFNGDGPLCGNNSYDAVIIPVSWLLMKRESPSTWPKSVVLKNLISKLCPRTMDANLCRQMAANVGTPLFVKQWIRAACGRLVG